MSRPIDEKIVKLSLDNRDFKDRVGETTSIFGKLKEMFGKTDKSADFSKATSNMKGLGAAADGINLGRIADGIEAMQNRFSFAGEAISAIISRLTNSVIDFGKKMISNVLDPIFEGGRKRALNIEQAMFQFEGLGMNVEKTMESALAAVQGTAFGLDEAAVAAAMFGASGMEAGDEMTNALRGISGVAAMAGSSYSDIANVFTSVAGNGRLMGNDLLRLSSRGINAAATLADSMNITEAEVRKMVTAGKIDFETFANAMNDAFGEHATKANETYSGSLSNLRAAFSRLGATRIAADLEQKKDLFNALTPVVDAVHDALKPLIEAFNEFTRMKIDHIIGMLGRVDFSGFMELGGMENIVQSFWNVVDSGIAILKAITGAFKDIFPPATAQTFVNLTEMVKNFTAGLVMSEETAEKVRYIFGAFFTVLKLGIDVIRTVASALLGIIPNGLGGGILDIVVYVADLVYAFNDWVRGSEAVEKAMGYLRRGIQRVSEIIGPFVSFLGGVLTGAINIFSTIWRIVGPILKTMTDAVRNFFGSFTIQDVASGGVIAFLVLAYKKISDVAGNLSGLFDRFGGIFSDFIGNSKKTFGIFESLGESLSALTGAVKATTLLAIAGAVGVLAVSLKLISTIDGADLSRSLLAVATSMVILMKGLKAVSHGGAGIKDAITAAVILPALATAILMMAGGLKIIASMNLRELAKGMAGLVGIVTTLTVSIGALSKFGGRIQTSSLTLVGLATSIVILTVAVKRLAQLSTRELIKGLGSLGIMFVQLGIFMRLANNTKVGIGNMIAIAGITGAIHIMVSAINRISDIPVKQLVKGLGVITAILAQMVIFNKLSGGSGSLSAATGMILVATALNMMVPPLRNIAALNKREIAKGLGTIAVVLTQLVVAMRLAQGGLSGAAAITVTAVAINLLVPALRGLGNLSINQIAKALGTLAASFTLMGIAARLVGGTAAIGLLAFAAALAAVGIAGVGIALGIATLSAAFSALAGATTTVIDAVVRSLGKILDGLIELVPKAAQLVVDVITAIATGLSDMSGTLTEAGANILLNVLKGIRDYLPQYAKIGIDMVIELAKIIEQNFGPLVDAGVALMIEFINSTATTVDQNSQPFVQSITRLFGSIIIVVIDAMIELVNVIAGWIPGVQSITGEMGEKAKDEIRTQFRLNDVGDEGASSFIDGINGKTGASRGAGRNLGEEAKGGAASVGLGSTGTDAANQYIREFENGRAGSNRSGRNVAESAKTGASNVKFTQTGRGAGQEYITGLGNSESGSRGRGRGIANAAKSGASAISFNSAGRGAGQGFAQGISSQEGAAGSAGRGLASRALNAVTSFLNINSPSVVLDQIGKWFGEGFGGGIMASGRDVVNKATTMASNAVEAVRGQAVRFNEALRDGMDMNPTITPVIDTSKLKTPNLSKEVYMSMLGGRYEDTVRDRNLNRDRSGRELVTANEYHVHLTTYGDLPETTVKRLAKRVNTEFKNEADRHKLNRGEAVQF